MLEQRTGVYDNPYKFNAKELDRETGLYYYGARYYNPRASIWYGVDPLAVYNPVMENQFYGDGQHNEGVYFWGNLNPYIYTYQNPTRYIDPNGKQVEWELLYNKWPKTQDDMTWKNGEVSNLDIFSYVYGEKYDRDNEVLRLVGQKPINMTNACATRGSIAYNKMGFGKYLTPDFKGLSGKMKDLNITSTAGQFKKVLDKIYKGNEDKIIKVENPTSEEQVQEAFGGKKGTFVMIAKKDAGYTGHVTIYNGKKVIGGNDHMYLKDAQVVYLYVADKNNK